MTNQNYVCATTVLSTLLAVCVATGQESRTDHVAQFDSKLLSKTLSELNTKTQVEFYDVAVNDALKQLSSRNSLTFEIEANSTKPVFLKANGTLGSVLAKFLAKTDCEFSIKPNGTILVRNAPKGRPTRVIPRK